MTLIFGDFFYNLAFRYKMIPRYFTVTLLTSASPAAPNTNFALAIAHICISSPVFDSE
jgi:hypothetical protein